MYYTAKERVCQPFLGGFGHSYLNAFLEDVGH